MENITKRFLLYNSEKHKHKIDSTFFDLISGDREPKQTKGLAAVFYGNHQFLFDFLNLDAIRKKTGEKVSPKNVTAIHVYAEKYTVDNKKADIVIRLNGKAGPLFAVIIEAKGIGAGHTNTEALAQQVVEYLKDDAFPDLETYKRVGVVLTKYAQYISGIASVAGVASVASVTWDQIIELLDKHRGPESDLDITSQYYKFLTHIGGAMKFYEEEVLSLPAGNTAESIRKHQVYSCEDESRNTNSRDPLFMAFREKSGGAMSTLYKLEYTTTLNFKDLNAIEILKNSDVDPDYTNRIEEYIKDLGKESFGDTEHRFYVFSRDGNIDLPKKPRPVKNNTALIYYTLKQMLEEETLSPKEAGNPE
jgi:hypothetical protein